MIDTPMDPLESLRQALLACDRLEDLQHALWLEQAKKVSLRSVEDAAAAVRIVAAWVDRGRPGDTSAEKLVALLLEKVWQAIGAAPRRLEPGTVAEIRELYGRLGLRSRARHLLLRALAADDGRESLAAFSELAVGDPPAFAADAAVAFVPLFQRSSQSAGQLFPRLLDALAHPAIAGVVLDLANYLARQGLVARHPAAERTAALASLLGELAMRLEQLQEHPRQFGSSANVAAMVSESVALLVALCDALGQIGDERVAGKLHQALSLSHRRVRTEAAAALARLGDPAGGRALAALAAEPAVRTRALAYLEELAIVDRVPEEHRSPQARAAGDLAALLSEPGFFGLAPTSIELYDERRQPWPGYDQPVDCYLFRYEYRLAGGSFWGIGIAGPMVHALHVDLADLPPSDIYAVYAGWFAEHSEIGESAPSALSAEEEAWWEKLRAELDEQFEAIELIKLGRFFGELHAVASARRGGHAGVLIHDGRQIDWHPAGRGSRPLTATELYQMHKGRKLLRAFGASP
jgi:hypothetical protein